MSWSTALGTERTFLSPFQAHRFALRSDLFALTLWLAGVQAHEPDFGWTFPTNRSHSRLAGFPLPVDLICRPFQVLRLAANPLDPKGFVYRFLAGREGLRGIYANKTGARFSPLNRGVRNQNGRILMWPIFALGLYRSCLVLVG